MHQTLDAFAGAHERSWRVQPEVSRRRHHRTMPWDSLDVGVEDVRTIRGFGRIGRLVLKRRERLGLSQRQLAQLGGIDQSVISRLETGRLRGIRWTRFARLVDAIGGIGETDPLPAWMTRFAPRHLYGGSDGDSASIGIHGRD